jgi:hypothetical protein
MDDPKAYRFRDFPQLFWDARPGELIDPENPFVLSRIITRGSMDALKKLVTPAVLRQRLPDLYLPDHIREFWELVLESISDGTSKS